MTRIIADLATAQRIGSRYVDTNPDAVSHRPFTYAHRGTNLTLYGAVIVMRDGSEREVREQ